MTVGAPLPAGGELVLTGRVPVVMGGELVLTVTPWSWRVAEPVSMGASRA